MRKSFRPGRFPAVMLVIGLTGLSGASLAQTPPSSRPAWDADRLFTAFIEDAAIVPEQWWEGRVVLLDGIGENDQLDITALEAVAAFQPIDDLEIGGRAGFADSDIDGSPNDGSGATDLDLWAKYYLGSTSPDTTWAVGGVLTVPTGDDAAGLGLDAFAISGFGAFRHRLRRATVTAHAGLQLNGDGRVPGAGPGDVDGELAIQLGAGVIAPVSDRVSVVGEGTYRGERLDGLDDDARILGGVNWRLGNRGIVRAALAAGLSDGAPDFQVLAGYAASF